MLVVALAGAFAAAAVDSLFPEGRLGEQVRWLLAQIDFNETLMHGMLCFLLFAGALHVDWRELVEHRWTIGILATVGVLLSTAIIGTLTWGVFRLLAVDVSLPVA